MGEEEGARLGVVELNSTYFTIFTIFNNNIRARGSVMIKALGYDIKFGSG
jgi:hypothetical protein